MRIGLYGGTFDPIHHGHLILARTAKEELGLDKVIFIPAAVSPHKLDLPATPPKIRWEMVCRAIEGEPDFAADDLEIERSGPSYTYDTALIYSENWPGAEIFYFVGQDNLAALATWHRIAELEKLVTFVVLNRGPRVGESSLQTINRRFDLSASEIRNRVAKGLSIRYLVTERVADAILERNLYKTLPPSN